MIYLRHFNNHSEVALLDKKNNLFKIITVKFKDEFMICGQFDYINSHLIALFLDQKNLKIQIDKVVFDLEIDKIVIYFTKSNNDNCKFDIFRNEELIFSENYYFEHNDKLGIFWAEEEEDVNFGLWLFNVLNNKERIGILLGQWSKAFKN